MCGQTSITHHDHIFFIIFELNDETLIMHTNTLYFSNMKCTMANAQVNLSFLENGRGGFYPSHTEYKFSVRTRYNQGTYCKIFYAVYFSTIILLLWYWIMDDLKKKIFLKIVILWNKWSSAWGNNLRSIYMYL